MMLNVSNLKKAYAQASTSIEVLCGIDLTLNEGDTVAILGQSGSGKSTLLSLLAGLDKPSSGSVVLAGEDLGQMTEANLSRHRAKNLGIVFQQFHLLPNLTALENVALPLEIAGIKGAEQLARSALAKVQLDHRSDHMPSQLSGGECQRVAIARAMVIKPAILLADEPSGNLDAATGESVMSLLFDLVRSERMTLVLVTHNPELAKRCDRQLHLNNGVLTNPAEQS